MSGIMQLLLASRPQAVPDPYFEYTTLLLPGNGTNGAQNNTFLDSSTNAFTITRNGNTTQGTFSPFSQTGWGNYFNGTNNTILQAPNGTAFQFPGDFTIDFWFYPTSFANYSTFFDGLTPGSASGARPTSFLLYGDITTGTIKFFTNSTTSTGTGGPTLNTWNFISLQRSGSTITVYVNGLSVLSLTNSTNFSNGYCNIGSAVASGDTGCPTGYLSNFRIVKGSALSPSIPTSPSTAVSGTSLLTCQANRFLDASSNAFAITVTGSPTVQAFSPFNPTAAWSAATNGGSGYFDGSGDFLACPDNAALEPGSSDLTWEMWINTTSTTQYATLYSRTTASFSSGMWSLMINFASGTAGDVALFVGDYSTSGGLLYANTVNVRDGAWHHIAVVRSGSAWTLYVDGVSRSTGTFAGAIADIAGGPYIGRDQFYGRDFSGYISGLRIVKGTAVYTAGFTPPTAPPTAITNTSLLLNYTNAGIYDATSKNDLETVGNAQISTTQSKFGGSSMYFDGTGDALYIPDTQNLKFGTGDFTIEAWVYLTATPSAQYAHIIGRTEYGTNADWMFQITNSRTLTFYMQLSYVATSTGTVPLNTWTHVAVTRSGSSIRLFINGTVDGTATNSGSTEQGGSGVYTIGADQSADEALYTGYINDLRTTKGYARYTSTFTPPTAAFPLF